jgi:hypothetical protein
MQRAKFKTMAFVLIAWSFIIQLQQLSYSFTTTQNENSNKLHLVRTIFIECVPDIKKRKTLEPYLQVELQRQGFKVAEDRASADAILSGIIQAEITVDGDGSDPDKSIYTFELTLLTNKRVWRGKVKFTSKSTFAEDNEYAARKIAERIARDWKKSAKRAGIK